MAKTAETHTTGDEGIGSRVKSWPARTKGFYGDVRAEMKKVTKPSAKEVRSMTGVVMVTVALFGIYFFLIDRILGFGIESLLQYFITR
jgi:preprotein translocase subunit SecE